MAFPSTALDVKVSLAVGADLTADPSTWTFTDYTTSIRERQKVVIARGRRSRAGLPVSMTCSATADNTDGSLARLNPLSSNFGTLKKNTPMRVEVNNGSGYVKRAAVFVKGFPPRWDPSEADQTVTLHGEGLLGLIGRRRALRSAMFRSMSGVAPGDYVPDVYYPMEDGSDARQFASGLTGGAPMGVASGVTPAGDTSVTGSEALPTFAAGVTQTSPIFNLTDTGFWLFQFMHRMDAFPVSENVFARILLQPGGTLAYIDVSLDAGGVTGSPIKVRARGYDASGTAHGTLFTLDLLTEGDEYVGQPILISVAFQSQSNGTECKLTVGVASAVATSGTGSVIATGTWSGFKNWQFRAPLACTFGHAAVFTDSSIDLTTSEFNREGLGGWAGEMAHDRVDRLCREHRIPCTVTATTSQEMGPQRSRRLIELLQECVDTDSGVLTENMTFGLTFLSSSERYNQSAAVTLAYGSRHILPPWEPDDDSQDFVNDVTVRRIDGSSYRAVDETSYDEVGEFSTGLPNANPYSDDQVASIAEWRKHLGIVDELTWPNVNLNIQAGGTLLDDWLAADIADRLDVTGHPSPLAPDTIRQIIEGYTEEYGAFTAKAAAVLSPASPWDVGVYDSSTLGHLDTAGSILMAPVTSGATSATVHTTVLPKWVTTESFPIIVSGQVNTVTAVSNVSPSFVAAGTAAHGNNASVSPGLPAGAQAGDLLLVFAAIRNSGTGTVDTPSGYEALLTFGNCALLGKLHSGTESAPTVTFTGGVANADTSAQMAAFRGVGPTVHASKAQLNGSAQNISYPQLDISRDNCLVLYLGWKQDDWTSVATIASATEIGEPSTTTGSDQGLVWDYVQQTTGARIASGSFTVTGGTSQISRGAVVALATDVQTFTLTRAVNGVTKALPIRSAVNVYRPAVFAL